MQVLLDYQNIFLQGAWLTLQVAILSLLLAVFLGVIGALAKISNSSILRSIATIYTTVIRGIPDIILMLIIFFGGQMLVNNVSYSLNEWLNEKMTSFYPTHEWVSYLLETFRGAIISVDKGQIEAGVSYGMSKTNIFTRITFPQMMRHALPGLGNNWLVLLKTTALV